MLTFPDFQFKQVVVVFPAEGDVFTFLNDNIVVKDGNKKIKLQATCHNVLAVWIIGGVTISSGLFERSKKFGFPILLLSYNMRVIGGWHSPTEGNTLLRRKQYAYKGLGVQKALVWNKVYNSLENLKTMRNRTEEQNRSMVRLKEYLHGINSCRSSARLLGIEGSAAKIYFGQWFDFPVWKGRKPRLKCDPVNTVLDMGYTYLFYILEAMLNLYGFDLFVGVYHTEFYRRKSLVCDIQEPFRAVVDKAVKRAYGLKQLQEKDFDLIRGQYRLKREKNKDYANWLLSSILEYRNDMFLYCRGYYRAVIQDKKPEDYPVFRIDKPYHKKD